jgi:hypothetical protein
MFLTKPDQSLRGDIFDMTRLRNQTTKRKFLIWHDNRG